MSLSSSEKYLIQDAVKEFRNQLQLTASLPLLDFNQVLKQSKLRNFLQQKKHDIIKEFLQNISNTGRDKRSVIMKELDSELKKAIESHMGHIENHKKQLEFLSEKLEDALCEGFRNLSEAHLSHNPYLDAETLRNFLQTQKDEVISGFDNHWKPGDSDFHQLRKTVLVGKLDNVQKEIEEKQRQFLENEKGLFSELKEGVLEKLVQVQNYMKSVKLEKIPIRLLEEEIGRIEQFIDEEGVFGMEEFRKVHEALLEKIKAATIGLYVTEETMLPEIARSLTRDLDVQLRSCFPNQNEDGVASQQQQVPAESEPKEAVVPVIDLENELPRKRLRTPVARLEKLPEPVAGTSRSVQVEVDDIQIIENNNEAGEVVQPNKQKKTNDAKVYKVFMNSKKAMTRAEKRRLLLEEDEAASQIQVISQTSPSGAKKPRGRPRSSASAADQVIPKPHASASKRSAKSTSLSELNNVPLKKGESSGTPQDEIARGPVSTKLGQAESRVKERRELRDTESKPFPHPSKSSVQVEPEMSQNDQTAHVSQPINKPGQSESRQEERRNSNESGSEPVPGTSKEFLQQAPLDDGVTTANVVKKGKRTLTTKQRQDLEKYGTTEPSENLTKSTDAVARNVAYAQETLANRTSSEGVLKRRRLNLDQEEVVAGRSKKPRLNEIPTPLEPPISTEEVIGIPLVFKLTSTVIRMGTQVEESFQELPNWKNELSTLPLVGVNTRSTFVCGTDALKCKRKWSLPDFLASSDSLFPAWSENVSFKLGQGKKVTHEITVEFLLGFLFKSMRESAQEQMQRNFESAVVTVPIWFCSSHRIQVKDAGMSAGFRQVHLVNEESVDAQATVVKNTSDRLIFVLSESFNVVNATLYEYNNCKLTLVKHVYFRQQSGAGVISVQNQELVQKMDELCQTLAIYLPRGNYRKFSTFSEESSWKEIFKTVSEKYGYQIIDSSGTAVLGKMTLEEIKTFCVEHLPEEFYYLDHLGNECQFLNYGKRIPKLFQLHMWEQNQSQSEGPNQAVQILQRNVKDGTVVSVAELDSARAFEYAKKQKWYVNEMKDIVPLSATLEVSSEAIFTFKDIEYLHGSVQKKIGDFVWTTPQNLSDEKRMDLAELVNTIWLEKKN